MYNPKTVFIFQDQNILESEADITLWVKRNKNKKLKQQIQNQSRPYREHPTKPNLGNKKSASKKEDICKYVHSTILKNGKETSPQKNILF